MHSILNSVLPVFALIGLGSLLKRLNMADDRFMAMSDRLVYYVFFPVLLFWKIGKPVSGRIVDWSLIAAVLATVSIAAVACLFYARYTKMPDRWVGSFAQGCYRFSSYVGIAVVLGCLGEEGVREFAVILGFVIPFINVLVITTCIWYSGSNSSNWGKTRFLVREMIANPLIWACLLGILYASFEVPFPTFVENTFSLMTSMAIPLALLSIGASIGFTTLRTHTRTALTAAGFKLVFMPAVGCLLMWAMGVTGTAFGVGMIYFALPTSPATYILSALLDSDVDVAVATIVSSTILSIVSLSVVVMAIG